MTSCTISDLMNMRKEGSGIEPEKHKSWPNDLAQERKGKERNKHEVISNLGKVAALHEK